MSVLTTIDLTLFELSCCAAFATSVVAALALTPAVRALALRWDVVDHSDGERKLHIRPVPLLGGVAILLAIALGGGLAMAVTGGAGIVLPLVVSGGLVCIVGVVDDVWSLQPRWKLLGQIVATWPILVSGLMIERVSIGGFELGMGWWAAPFTVIWLVSGVNAFNFTDGVDGLASLIGLVAVAALSVVAVINGNTAPLLLLLAVGGALCGFLVFNLPPARIYLGDAGSMLIGLTVSLLAVQTVRTETSSVALIPLILLTAIPLADMTLAVVRRTQTGIYFWRADRQHMHHRLLQRGFGSRSVLAMLGTLSAAIAMLGVTALITGYEGWACAAAVGLALGLVRARYFGHHEWSLVKRNAGLGVLALTARWWSRRYRADLPPIDQLAALTFEDSWIRFVGELAEITPARLNVTVGNRGRIYWKRDWSSPALADDDADAYTVQIRSESNDGGWSVMRAHLGEAERMPPPNWFSLIAALEHFGRFWAVQQHVPSDARQDAAVGDARRAAA